MADAFDPKHGERLEDPARLAVLPQAAVVSLMRLRGDETIVDYGAGIGVYTIPMAAAVPDGRVIAVEELPPLARELRDRVPGDLGDRLQVVETDANMVPESDGVADRVVMVDVLHHLYDQPGALAEATRLLRPGGLFVVVDWGDCARPVGPPPGHVLGLAAVRELVSNMGLEEVEVHEPGGRFPYHLAVVAAKRGQASTYAKPGARREDH